MVKENLWKSVRACVKAFARVFQGVKARFEGLL